MFKELIDIKENNILSIDYELLDTLLKDKSSGKNILWGTDNYSNHGIGFRAKDYMFVEKITGFYGELIKPLLAEPNFVCSGTYIVCGPFDSEKEAQNVMKYINTKFFHFLLSLKKFSQENTNKCYEFIPKLDFRQEYNDETLFKMFDLTEEEIKYIYDKVRADIGFVQKNKNKEKFCIKK